MSQSKEDSVKKSGTVLRADVFYEPEYRELCLQQLNIYNETKMSLNYLKDLVETTHVFMKLMDLMSKGKHLMIRTKKIRKAASKKRIANKLLPNGNLLNQQNNEEIWDQVSSHLSSCLQEGADIPTDISPFDATSETPIDEQKLMAMIRIQDFMHQKQAAQAAGLLRAAREVWPEQETFGAQGADPEDEFMTLREILFAELPRPRTMSPNPSESYEMPGQLDNIEQELEEGESEEEYQTYSSEQEFDFKGLASRFAVKSVCHAYSLLFANYEKNSDYTNHCIVKMFHRIAWDCGLPAMIFNMSVFRTFQKIHYEYKINKNPSMKELERFAKYLLTRFFDTSKTNKKVFMELLFWKTTREASEILDGYSTQTTSKKDKERFWAEDEEETLQRVFHQLKESRDQCNVEELRDSEYDLLDSITAHFIDSGKSRRQVAKKLKELNLITDTKEVTRKPLKTKGRIWNDEENERLKSLYEEYKDAVDPVSRIREHLFNQRTKRNIIERILELQLCNDPSKLKRKINSRRKKRDSMNALQNESNSDSACESSSSDSEESATDYETKSTTSNIGTLNACSDSTSSMLSFQNRHHELIKIIQVLPKGIKPAFDWLIETLEEAANDKEDDDDVASPLLAIDNECIKALENQQFQQFLKIIQFLPPSELQNEQYWRIPATITKNALLTKASLIKRIILQEEGDDVDVDDLNIIDLVGPRNEASKMAPGLKLEKKQTKKKKKGEKRGKGKWMPMRRALDPEAQARINAGQHINLDTNSKSIKKSGKKTPRSTSKRKAKDLAKINNKNNPQEENEDIHSTCESSSDDDLLTSNGTSCFTTNKRKIRPIINDSSSDEDTETMGKIEAPNTNAEDGNNTETSNNEKYASDDSPIKSIGAKRRILDDSSSDEGVIDPYPGEKQQSLLSSTPSSPVSRSSIITSSILTPSIQSSKSNTPMSKRNRESSSPESTYKRQKNDDE